VVFSFIFRCKNSLQFFFHPNFFVLDANFFYSSLSFVLDKKNYLSFFSYFECKNFLVKF